MLAETPAALRYILPNDVYLLRSEKEAAGHYIAAIGPCISEGAGIALTAAAGNVVAEPATVYDKPEDPFNYHGGYQKKILVLVHYPAHEIMEPAHQTALMAALTRLDICIDDIALLNTGKLTGVELTVIENFFKPEKLLVLGKAALPAGLTPPAVNQCFNSTVCKVLYTFAFDEMLGNKDNTRAFWEQMKLF